MDTYINYMDSSVCLRDTRIWFVNIISSSITRPGHLNNKDLWPCPYGILSIMAIWGAAFIWLKVHKYVCFARVEALRQVKKLSFRYPKGTLKVPHIGILVTRCKNFLRFEINSLFFKRKKILVDLFWVERFLQDYFWTSKGILKFLSRNIN